MVKRRYLSSKVEVGPVRDLDQLEEMAQQKRYIFFERAQIKRARRRHLQVVSGILGLLAGFAASAVFVDFIGGVVIKICTAVVALLSGTVTLLSNSYYNTRETDKMFEAAAEFLALREKIDFERTRVGTADQRESALGKFKTEYVKLSSKYDEFFPPGSWSTDEAEGSPKRDRRTGKFRRFGRFDSVSDA